MENVSLSILVVNCKDYQPSYNWYFCKSESCFCGTANDPSDLCYNEARLNAYNASDDYVQMPDCHGMTDEEAAEIVKIWCEENGILYTDDMDSIENAYRWYYKYDDYMSIDSRQFVWHHAGRG